MAPTEGERAPVRADDVEVEVCGGRWAGEQVLDKDSPAPTFSDGERSVERKSRPRLFLRPDTSEESKRYGLARRTCSESFGTNPLLGMGGAAGGVAANRRPESRLGEMPASAKGRAPRDSRHSLDGERPRLADLMTESGGSMTTPHRSQRNSKSKEESRLLNSLLRSARFVPLVTLKHAAESRTVIPTETVVEAVVIFADVSGYTALAEMCNSGEGGAGGEAGANLVGSSSTGLAGAERMRDALNEYLGNMIDMLTGHGADIVKFAGDAMMAVWEVDKMGQSPSAAADTAALATAVCLEMGAALDEYTCQGLPKGCTLRLHTAIGYGSLSMVVVGGVDGHWLQLPVGDPIAQVAPILDAAPPGTLVVSRQTHELLRNTFVCKPLLKAGSEEVIGMRVLRRLDDFPEHLASYVDTGFAEISENIYKKAEKKEMMHLARRSRCFDYMHDSVMSDTCTLSHTSHTSPPSGHSGGCRNLGDPLSRIEFGLYTSPRDGKGNSMSGGRAYRQRVVDIFDTVRKRNASSPNMATLAAKAALREEHMHVPLVTQASYDAVLSFIPLPCRVALTGSIAELRRITVMFITLDSSAVLLSLRSKQVKKDGWTRPSRARETPLSPTGSSVQLQQLQYLASTMQQEVTHHNGFVKELTMDDKGLVMVVGFGVPPCCRWTQDPVLGACEAALAIKIALKTYGHRCGIGLTTGELFCGTIGNNKRSEYSMIGSVVNLAARLMGAAAKLEKGIFMDKATKEVAVRDGLMECKFYDYIKVKGKSEQVPVWRLKNTRRKLDSRPSFDMDEREREALLNNTLMNTMNRVDLLNNTRPALKATQKYRRCTPDITDDPDDVSDGFSQQHPVVEMVGREQEMREIREVMKAAIVDGVVETDTKTKKRGKEGEKSSGKGGGSGGVMGALFGSCLGYSGSANAGRGSANGDKTAKSGKLVLIEGEAGIGKTCLLGAVERSARLESGFMCFRTNFSTRQEASFGWWYILRQMQVVLGDRLETLLSHSQSSRLSLLNEVGNMMPEMGKEMGKMGTSGIKIRRELTHALLLLMDVMTTTPGVPGIMLILDDAANLEVVGLDVVRHILQPLSDCYDYTTRPFFPKVRNLVVVMAMRPICRASPSLNQHYTSMCDLADARIVLSGLSREQLCDQLLKSEELRKRGVDKIGHTALCFLHERSSGNFRQALAWMAELVDGGIGGDRVNGGDRLNGGVGGRHDSRGSNSPCHRHSVTAEEQSEGEDDWTPSRPSLVVLQGCGVNRLTNVRQLETQGISTRGSLDGYHLGPIMDGQRFVPPVNDYDHHQKAAGGGELVLDPWQTMQACVRIPMDVRAIYTAVNDSLSPSELLALRMCSVLGEITPETLVYAQPGGLADFFEAGGARGVDGAEAWRGGPELAHEDSDPSRELDTGEVPDRGEVPDLKKTLKTLIERGFLVLRTRGKVSMSANTLGPAVVTRDSLDGTTAVLSNHVTKIRDTHPMLEGKVASYLLFGDGDDDSDGDGDGYRGGDEPTGQEASELLTFASFVHQEVTYQGWGLEHRRKVHERMSDVATAIMKDLQVRMNEFEANSSPSFHGHPGQRGSYVHSCSVERTRQKLVDNVKMLLVATHTWRIHHTMMAGDLQAAREAWVTADEEVGKGVVRSLCRHKVLNVFSKVPDHFSSGDSPQWSSLHVVLLPWLRGVAQMFQLDARRRWALVRATVPWLRLAHELRRRRLAAIYGAQGSGLFG